VGATRLNRPTRRHGEFAVPRRAVQPRRGERAPDVDFEGGHVQITKSLEEIGGQLRIKDVKTKKRRRRLDLSRQARAALHERRKRMLAAGSPAGPVFCDTQGGRLRLTKVHRNSYKPILKRAGLPSIRLYDLRHTCATLLLLANESPKVVS